MNHNIKTESSIVVKTCLGGDIRRFSIGNNQSAVIHWSQFVEMVSKLYSVDVSQFKMTYKDEEGDDVVISSKEELKEAFDVARCMKPPTLRLQLIMNTSDGGRGVIEDKNTNETTERTQNTSSAQNVYPPPADNFNTNNNQNQTKLLSTCPPHNVVGDYNQKCGLSSSSSIVQDEDVPIVYIAGKPFMPPKVISQPSYGCTKVSSVPTPTSPPSTTTISNARALSNLTSSISDSVSSNVIRCCDTTLAASANASASAVLYTQAESDATLLSNHEVWAQMAYLTKHLAKQSISDPMEATLRNLSRISNDTSKTSSDASAWTTAMVLDSSLSIHDDVAPVSQKTMDLQSRATVGLESGMDRDIDAVVKSIMSVTPSW